MNPFLLVAAFGLIHFGAAEVRRFEADAAREILTKLSGERAEVRVRSTLGPEALWGDVYRVKISASKFSTEGLPLFTEPKRSTRGILRNLEIELSDFNLRGLHVQSLSATIPDCRFDLGLALKRRQVRLSRSGVGRGSVTIAEADLETFILRKFAEIKQVKVTIDRDKVIVEGYGEFVVFKTNFYVVAKLRPVEGVRLMLTDARILFDGKRPDPESERALLDTLNPVIDLDKDLKLYGAVQIERLELRNGLLRAFGATRIPELQPR